MQILFVIKSDVCSDGIDFQQQYIYQSRLMLDEVKVVVIGPVGVGKSSLTNRFIFNQFNQNMTTTLGAAYFQKVHGYGQGKSVKFQFWDTAGQQRFRAIAKIYYKDARVAIVMYDVTSRQSFQGLKIWMDELKQKGPENLLVVIVGNKVDLLNHSVSAGEAQQYARQHNALFKLISAKQDNGIKQLFDSIAIQVQNKKAIKKDAKSIKKNTKKNNNQNKCC